MTIDIDLTNFSEHELLELNHLIVARVRALHQAQTYQQLATFNLGERVWFQSDDGRRIEGVVVNVNKKTVTIHSDDHHHWRVSPGYLRKAGKQETAITKTNVIELARR